MEFFILMISVPLFLLVVLLLSVTVLANYSGREPAQLHLNEEVIESGKPQGESGLRMALSDKITHRPQPELPYASRAGRACRPGRSLPGQSPAARNRWPGRCEIK